MIYDAGYRHVGAHTPAAIGMFRTVGLGQLTRGFLPRAGTRALAWEGALAFGHLCGFAYYAVGNSA
jgi:hypothetical protein